jgi:TPR repeat protein
MLRTRPLSRAYLTSNICAALAAAAITATSAGAQPAGAPTALTSESKNAKGDWVLPDTTPGDRQDWLRARPNVMFDRLTNADSTFWEGWAAAAGEGADYRRAWGLFDRAAKLGSRRAALRSAAYAVGSSVNPLPDRIRRANEQVRALADGGFGPAWLYLAQRAGGGVALAMSIATATGRPFEPVMDSLRKGTKYTASGFEGLGPITPATPLEWLAKAQAAGDAQAILQRAAWIMYGYFGLKRDADSATALLVSTLDTDDPTAMRRAGELLLGWGTRIGEVGNVGRPIGVPENRELAARLLLRAAGLGSSPALRLAARVCEVQANLPCHKDAWLLHDELASRGDTDAWVDVAQNFYAGQGAPKDTAIAVTYLTKAAQSGSQRARYTLAMWAEQGRGMPPNQAWANLMLDSLAMAFYHPAVEEVGVRALFGVRRPRNEEYGARLLTSLARNVTPNERYRYPRATYYAAWYAAQEAFADTTSWTVAPVEDAYQLALSASVLQERNPSLLTGYDAAKLVDALFRYKKAREQRQAEIAYELRRQTIAANRAQWAAQLDAFAKNLGAAAGPAPSAGSAPTPYRLIAPETCARLAQVREATAQRLGLGSSALGAGPCQ